MTIDDIIALAKDVERIHGTYGPPGCQAWQALRTIVNSVNEWGSVCVSEVALSVVRRIIAGGGK